MTSQEPIFTLAALDPDLYESVRARLAGKPSVSEDQQIFLVEETLWGVSVEPSFGVAVARGYACLLGSVPIPWINEYRDLIRRAGASGPAIGLITAVYAKDVVLAQNRALLDQFLETKTIMLTKGSYTLKPPFEALSRLLETRDTPSAIAYLALLRDVFSTPLSYNHSLRLTHSVPKTVTSFPAEDRLAWINGARRIIQTDIHLFDDFIDGLTRGVALLNAGQAHIFITEALKRRARDQKQGRSFLALESVISKDFLESLQTAVPFDCMRTRMNRYIRARTALPITVRPMSEAPAGCFQSENADPRVVSDGMYIYLPDEIRISSDKSENEAIYQMLVKFELAYYEFKTFSFDPERLNDIMENRSGERFKAEFCNTEDAPDPAWFFREFDFPHLAEDLFIVFEQARLMRLSKKMYPGLTGKTFEPLRREALSMIEDGRAESPLFNIYARLALSLNPEQIQPVDPTAASLENQIIDIFNSETDSTAVLVEHCAVAVIKAYPKTKRLVRAFQHDGYNGDITYKRLKPPFIGGPRPDLVRSAHARRYQKAHEIKNILQSQGVKIYKADIADHLIEHKGELSSNDIKRLVFSGHTDMNGQILKCLHLSGLQTLIEPDIIIDDADGRPVFRYPEWDSGLDDYLQDYVRVVERPPPEGDPDFYALTLQRRRGLAGQIRKTFELLKPQRLKILRQWIEGDEFDYRALLNFAIDKKAGRTPSERLYVNRIKQNRDVAVLVLADLSRSTANQVPGSDLTVLDIEKEALVLFCEALHVVGDRYAIGGFSGNGRLGLDFYTVKQFRESLDDSVKARISGLSQHRNTRMGGAVRHAAGYLEKMNAKVRILMIIGDGFPNDLGYKGNYAIEDTRKAILETRSKNIAVKAIIVNAGSDKRLDTIFGSHHYNTIANVEALPGKLIRIYAKLTS